ncbi:hypothetical protein D6853_02405 [Butyrivibrio sp. X503]|uniref:CdaR family protein n=1 Tax=Butyrivibrio sp. X503 TaxID=2364878 RepID=UPI000EAA8739|nr:CdaR family protein [Butyrivibrio sp. X503]RKM58405.1 hypothetical protein D6853_02405 [Butyrivibrio sp. X503]
MKKLTANWVLKLVSLLFAFIVWFLVTNINDPVISKTYYNIQVSINGFDQIEKKGQIPIILDESDVVSSVKVSAPRSVIDNLSKENIIATADVQDISSLNTLSINFSSSKSNDKIQNFSPSSDVVKLNIEKKETRTLEIKASTLGEDELTGGDIVGPVNLDQNMVRVSGPESVIKNIKKAAVEVDVRSGLPEVNTNADIVLYDNNDEVIDPSSSHVEMNIKSVGIHATIYSTKAVSIKYPPISGKPAEGYMRTGEITSNPQKVLIAAKKDVLKNIDSITVEADDLDITGLRDNLSHTYDLEEYLPEGVIFGNPEFSGKATVIVHIGAIAEKTVDVSIKNITVGETPEGFDVEINDKEYETVSLTLEGLESKINTLNPETITGTVDINKVLKNNNLTEPAEGMYSAEVEWTLPDGVEAKAPVSVYISVKNAE